VGALVSAIFLAAPVKAQSSAPLQGVLNLSATASVEVSKDVLVLTFAASREGSDATAVQNELKRALDAALAEARRVAQPQQLEVSTGNFSLYPRQQPRGGAAGWSGRAEMTVQGRDMAAIGQLSARITTMTIAGVSYRLSPQAQRQVEADVAAQAIARFRALAGELSRQFGYQGYAVREVTVSIAGDGDMPVPMFRSAPMADVAAAPPLPIEPGRGQVTASVSGSVQMQ
jgi:predicted secreted protein